MSLPEWRKDVLRQLQKRNQREVEPFQNLINLQRKSLEARVTLVKENNQLAFQNEKLKEMVAKESKDGVEGGHGTPIGMVTSEEVALLKKKIYEYVINYLYFKAFHINITILLQLARGIDHTSSAKG